MDDDEIDIELRTPSEVAVRCIILTALLHRVLVESLAETTNDRDLAAEAFDIRGWLQTEGLWDQLDTTEIAFLESPIGRLDEEAIATVASQAEGLATLGWALGLSDRLPSCGLCDVETVVKMVPSPWDPTEQWIRDARLQAETEIARERDRSEINAWRLGIEAPMRNAVGQEQTEFAQAIADVAREAATAGLAESTRAGDIAVGGLEIESLDDQDLERLTVIAGQRLRALNWLCGFGETWDQVPLEV